METAVFLLLFGPPVLALVGLCLYCRQDFRPVRLAGPVAGLCAVLSLPFLYYVIYGGNGIELMLIRLGAAIFGFPVAVMCLIQHRQHKFPFKSAIAAILLLVASILDLILGGFFILELSGAG